MVKALVEEVLSVPIKIAGSLPARKVLKSENIFVMDQERATKQDIRPLRILILNLMPDKIKTETQLLRLLSNSPLQVEMDLLQAATHVSKNTPAQHLLDFYKTYDEVKDLRYDGMIITGAPVEHLPYEEVNYWEELCTIMEWSKKHVFSTLHICWGAQAGLYYHYGIPKYAMEKKLSGVFYHRLCVHNHPLTRGFDEVFMAPHSRYAEVRRQDVDKVETLQVLAESNAAGIYLVASKDGRQIFVTGHCEYDRDTLANEYTRDVAKGIHPEIPYNYFPDNNPEGIPVINWRSHAHLLFSNWLNYYVYQRTPYDLEGHNLEEVPQDEEDA